MAEYRYINVRSRDLKFLKLNCPLTSVTDGFLWLAAAGGNIDGVMFDCSTEIRAVEENDNLRCTVRIPCGTADLACGIRFQTPVKDLTIKLNENILLKHPFDVSVTHIDFEVPIRLYLSRGIMECTFILNSDVFDVPFSTDHAKYLAPVCTICLLSTPVLVQLRSN